MPHPAFILTADSIRSVHVGMIALWIVTLLCQ